MIVQTASAVLLCCIANLAFAQPRPMAEDTLALIDRDVITTRDLFERLELMPFEGSLNGIDVETAKRRAVESLVGERLLATMPGASAGHEEWRSAQMRSVLEKMFVRDALFLDEVRQKVTVTDEEMREAMRRSAVRRRLLVFRPPDATSAHAFVRSWQDGRRAGAPPVELMGRMQYQRDTVLISYGSIDPVLEEAAFSIKELYGVAGPADSPVFGVLVVVFLGDEPNENVTRAAPADRRANARVILLERKENQRVRDFTDAMLRGHTMTADSILAGRIMGRLRVLMASDTLARRVTGGFRPLPEDMYVLMREETLSLQSPLVQGTFGDLSLGDFLEGLLHYDFVVPFLRPRSFRVSFSQIVRAMVEAEIVAREGLRRGLQNRTEVRRDVDRWMGHWRSRWVEYSVAESVTVRPSDAVFSLWRYQTSLVESTCVINVREILRPDSASCAQVLDELSRGAAMDSLARQWTIRDAWRNRGGESGWFLMRDHKDVAARTMNMEVGETRGPVRLPEGVAILSLLGRRFEGDAVQIDSLIRREGRRVRLARQHAAVNRFVARQAAARNVTIFYDRIRSADVARVRMITRRLIGFGGRMNAAPFLTPQWEWVDEWKRLREQLP